MKAWCVVIPKRVWGYQKGVGIMYTPLLSPIRFLIQSYRGKQANAYNLMIKLDF